MPSKQDLSQDIQVETTRTPGCKLKAEVKLGSVASARAHQEALAAVRKKASLPGFRKGRAPEAMISSHFAPQIEAEVRTKALSLAMFAVIEKEKTTPLHKDQVGGKIDKLSKEEIICTVEFETTPEIPELDPSTLSVEIEKPEAISPEKVEERLEEIRKEQGEWKSLEPTRAIKEGDHVVLDIIALGDADSQEEQEPRPVCEDNRFLAEEKAMGAWLLKLILDKKTGDVVEGVSERDESLPEEAPFIATRYRVTIKDLVESIPLSDEKVAESLETETLEEAKEQLLKGMTAQAEADAQHATKEKIAESLIENYTFDLPGSIVEGFRQTGIKRAIRAMQASGVSEEEIKEGSGEIEAQVLADNQGRLTLFFLADKYFRQHNPKSMEISGDEMKSAYFRELLMPPAGVSVLDKEMTAEESRSALTVQIIGDRLLSHLATVIA